MATALCRAPNGECPVQETKLRVLIADDELPARQRLREFVQAEPGAAVVAECVTGMETVAGIRAHSPDLVFLDVQMPELDGFGVVEALGGGRLPVFIFVTAHDRFAVRAFEANAVDYLLKPFGQERFQHAIRRARQRLRTPWTGLDAEFLSSLKAGVAARAEPLERVTVKSGGRYSVVKVADLDWIRAADNYVELHAGGTTHLLRMTLTMLATQLPGNCWVQISRSHLVNLERIKEIRSKPHGDYEVVLYDGTRLGGTRNYRANLKTLFW